MVGGFGIEGAGEKQVADARILGDGDFVQGVLSEMDDFAKENLRFPRPIKNLSVLTQKVCDLNQVAGPNCRRDQVVFNGVGPRELFDLKEDTINPIFLTGAISNFLRAKRSLLAKSYGKSKATLYFGCHPA